MSLTMLVEDEGRNYTAAEYQEWLTGAGFHNPRCLPLNVPGANGVIVAEKPWAGGMPRGVPGGLSALPCLARDLEPAPAIAHADSPYL
jgi:hypothetical protein